MNNMKGILAIAFLIVMTGLTGTDAFGFLGIGGDSWKEEVLLHDGGKLIVERWVDRGGRHEIGQRPPIKEQSLTFTLPSSKQTVTWKVEYCQEVGYADLSPIMLGIVDETPYLVTHPVACLAYNKWKRPNPPYIVFRYTNKAWQQIELEELPMDLKVPNLIISSPDSEVERANTRFMSVEKVRTLNDSLSQPQYQTILREPLKPGALGVSCEELIDYKCNGDHMGWGAPGEFNRRYFEDKCKQINQSLLQNEHHDDKIKPPPPTRSV
jgi:hypothetical protein